MAEQRNRRTTAPYVTNGSAAYDRAYVLRTSEPERQPSPVLPEERPARRPKPIRVRAKLVLSPFAIVGCAAVAVMLFMMISAFVRLYETTEDVSDLNSTLKELREQQAILTTQYESKIDLSRIETMAGSELGMSKPGSDQTVYVNLSEPDQAEVITPDRAETARTAWEAFRESLADLLSDLRAYFR